MRDWYKGERSAARLPLPAPLLQALQWLRGPERWVLKSPQHLEQQAALIEIFPDATFVQTHRDPLASRRRCAR